MIKRVCFALLFCVFASQSYAEKVWYDNMTVKSVSYYYDGSNDVVEVTWDESITTGCAAGDTNKKASVWRAGVIDHQKLIYSTLMTAYTTKNKVSLMLDSASCNTNYGVRLYGVKFAE